MTNLKKAGVIILLLLLAACGNPQTDSVAAYKSYQEKVDACIVQKGVGAGVRDYCESLARMSLTATPALTPETKEK